MIFETNIESTKKILAKAKMEIPFRFFWFAALHYGQCQLPMFESMVNGEFIKIDMKIHVIFRLFYNIRCWYVLQLFIFHAKYELVRFCMLNNEFVIFMVTTGFRMNLNFEFSSICIRYAWSMKHTFQYKKESLLTDELAFYAFEYKFEHFTFPFDCFIRFTLHSTFHVIHMLSYCDSGHWSIRADHKWCEKQLLIWYECWMLCKSWSINFLLLIKWFDRDLMLPIESNQKWTEYVKPSMYQMLQDFGVFVHNATKMQFHHWHFRKVENNFLIEFIPFSWWKLTAKEEQNT